MLRPRRIRDAEGADAGEGRCDAGHRRPRRSRCAPALGALGRPATARGRRPGIGARARGVAVRRAVVEPRRATASADAGRNPRPAAAAGAHRRVRDPRSVRGARRLRSHHRDEPGRDRAGGRAARAVFGTEGRLRRELHGRGHPCARHVAAPRCGGGKRRAGPAHALHSPSRPARWRDRGRHSPGGDRAAADRCSRRCAGSCARRPISAT